MIWSNDIRRKIEKKMSWGTLNVITLGEAGRGRKEFLIPSNWDIEKGINESLNIGFSRSNRPKVMKGNNNKRYLIINTYAGYTRRGNGFIAYDPETVSILLKGNGADGDAGRIGSWDDLLVEVKVIPSWIRVNYSGGRGADYTSIIHITETNIVEVSLNNIDLYLDKIGESIPALKECS